VDSQEQETKMSKAEKPKKKTTTPTEAGKLTIRCAATGQSAQVKATPKGAPRPPTGWKHWGEQYYSPAGWKSLFVLRAITIPVSGPAEGADWPELRTILKSAWGQATSLSNWAISELSRRDTVRGPAMEKLPPMARCYLYPQARALFPGIATASVVSILTAVERKYRKLRYELVWRSAISLPSFRYPTPYPVHNQGWKASRSQDDRREPLVSANVGGHKIALRLRGGVEFRRQLAAFDQIAAGEAVPGELALYERRVSMSAGRNGIALNGGAGEQRTMSRIMCKMVAWLPRGEPPGAAKKKSKARILTLCTSPSSLLMGTLEGREEPWLYNADHARRWVATERAHMERLRQDLKAESRRAPLRKLMASRMASWSAKHKRRLETLCHQASAAAVGFAARQRATQIVYDDSCRQYLPSFPWADLAQKILYKADGFGISFVTHSASAAVGSKTP
jgi:hypothetical protein